MYPQTLIMKINFLIQRSLTWSKQQPRTKVRKITLLMNPIIILFYPVLHSQQTNILCRGAFSGSHQNSNEKKTYPQASISSQNQINMFLILHLDCQLIKNLNRQSCLEKFTFMSGYVQWTTSFFLPTSTRILTRLPQDKKEKIGREENLR